MSPTSNAAPPESSNRDGVRRPPGTFFATLRHLGPGVIIAGSIVGSGELIATTKAGAQAGFWLLWLILIGCTIKVFTQVEFGRYTVTWGRTSLDGLNSVPGPRLRVNWLLWYWLMMTVLVLSQQGGIVGGVGQALAIARPLTERGQTLHEMQDRLVNDTVRLARLETRYSNESNAAALEEEIETLTAQVETLTAEIDTYGPVYDVHIWASLAAVCTAVILFIGRYQLIQMVSIVLVAAFTVVTIATLLLLQAKPDWCVTGPEMLQGLSFRLPPVIEGLTRTPLATALAAFGIIGVGAAELIMYPYWVLEKGYARSAGPRDESPEWLGRARGWMRVMQIDAWISMAVYTFATVAFYLLGAAVLGRAGLDPEGKDLIRTLAQMYVPVFGAWAHSLFLFGAFAVLYSTFFVACAGNARMTADGLGLFGLFGRDEASRIYWTRILSGAFPLIALVIYLFVQAPVAMILACGISQAIMLPMLGGAALYFRYRRCDPRLTPGRVWTAMLWLSFAGFMVAGVWSALTTLLPHLGRS